VQRLCNALTRFQLADRLVQPLPVDVQIAAGRADVGVSQDLAHVDYRDMRQHTEISQALQASSPDPEPSRRRRRARQEAATI
jgi:hypothetical protein